MEFVEYRENDFRVEVVDQTMTSIFSDFSCGNEVIDAHFRSNDFRENVRYAYIDTKRNMTAGLADICCSAVNWMYDGKIVDMLSAVKINHFAVSLAYQDTPCTDAEPEDHFYLSDLFLCKLLGTIRNICDCAIGAEYVVVHSVPDAVHFYERNLFVEFSPYMKTESNRYLEGCIPMIVRL